MVLRAPTAGVGDLDRSWGLPSLKVDHILTVQLYPSSANLAKLGAEPKLESDGSLAAIR
jgi:hypothetical protein